MLSFKLSMPEVVSNCKELISKPGKILGYLKQSLVKDLSKAVESVMEAEITMLLGNERYQRKTNGSNNRRNGYRTRNYTLKGIGQLTINVPRDRLGKYETKVIPRYKRYDEQIAEESSMLFLLGMSTRNVSLLSKQLFGRSLSRTQISENNKGLNLAIEQWRTRSLEKEDIKYLFVDGVNFQMRIAGKIQLVPVLVVLSVDRQGLRKIIGLQAGDKESAVSWRELFKDLKSRGLNGTKIELGIMDGLSGLEKVFAEEFPNSKVQRCQVHVLRNVLA